MPSLLKEIEQTQELNAQQQEALAHFKKLGFPTTKHEEWKYSNVKKIIEKDLNLNNKEAAVDPTYKKSFLGSFNAHHLYFVNGRLIENAASKELTVGSIKDADKSLVDTYFGKHVDIENEAFLALNTALTTDGSIIHIKKNTTLDLPIFCHYISDVSEADQVAQVRNLLVFEENTEAKVIESFVTIGEKTAIGNAVTEIFVGKNARIDYYKIQNENNESSHIGTTQVFQEGNSYFYAATFSLNGGFIRNNLNIILGGEHVDTHMVGLYIPNESQHIDNHTVVDHAQPNCESNELYKGILMDSSTGVFNGKIFVREDAQKTNAYQNCRNVVTSDTATMNSKPQLEIWADDVKCSHGTTTGQLNDEAIFYMQSRGIPKKEAIRLQLLAFAEDVIIKIKIDELKEYLAEQIAFKLDNSLVS